MTDPPPEVRTLAARRDSARQRGDYAAADALREEIRRAGYAVVDRREGSVLEPAVPPDPEPAPPPFARPEDVPSVLGRPPSFDASVQWIVQGWPEDVERGLAAFARFTGAPGSTAPVPRQSLTPPSVQHLVIDAAATGHPWPYGVEVLRLAPTLGWGAARNAGLRRADGTAVVLVDGSIEPTGDVLTPLLATLEDPSIGVTGPFGLVTDDLRSFHPSAGPEVDAVESYLLAVPRRLVERGLCFDERFRFYRMADVDLSFRVKAEGLRATVTPVPVRRHEHRAWTNTTEARREQLSKRNFYRFLDRWRGRADLTVAGTRDRS